MSKYIYPASEDSFLLLDCLKNQKIVGKVLEIGTGSGIIGGYLHNKGIDVIVTDINPFAVKRAREMGLKVIESDLFDNVEGKYDIIIFNPPYLPGDVKTEKWLDKATIGGRKGSETIKKFLKQAKKHLEKNGRIYIVFSSRTNGIKTIARELGYCLEILGSKSFFFEKIFVAKLTLLNRFL